MAVNTKVESPVSRVVLAPSSLLSLLPPENATGNFVKVVQRFPVRIDIDPNQNDDHRLETRVCQWSRKSMSDSADVLSASAPLLAPEPWRPKFNPWLIGVVVAMAAFMEVLDTSIANVALPYMAGGLGSSNDESTCRCSRRIWSPTPSFSQSAAG